MYYYHYMKRVYNLSPATIATIRRLVEVDGIAPSRAALVELAIAELDRHIRDARDAELWTQASRDSAFVAELRQIDEDLSTFSYPNTVTSAGR